MIRIERQSNVRVKAHNKEVCMQRDNNSSYGQVSENLKQVHKPASQPVFNIPAIIVAIIAICAGVYVLQYYLLSNNQQIRFLMLFGFIPARFTFADGFFDLSAWMTTITYSFMHGGFAHLAVNIVWLAAFGSPLAGRIGAVRFLSFWALTAIIAAFTHYAFYSESLVPLVGASGAISGMMGAAARFGFHRVTVWGDNGRQIPAFGGALLSIPASLQNRTVLTFVGFWFVINILTGLYSVAPGDLSGIAWEAHIGGFVAGYLAIIWFDRPDFLTRR